MLSPITYACMAAVIGLLVAGRLTMDRAFHRLPPEQKLALMEGFPASFNSVRVLPNLVLVSLLFLGVPHLPSSAIWPAYFVLWVLVLAYVSWTQRFVVARSRQLGAPEGYLRTRARAGWLSVAAYAAMCATHAGILNPSSVAA